MGGKIKEENKRVVVIMPETTLEEVREAAEQDNRSVSNWILTVVEEKLKEGK